MSERDENRAKAREIVARDLLNSERRKGNDPTYESIRRQVNEIADRSDNRRDRNIKE